MSILPCSSITLLSTRSPTIFSLMMMTLRLVSGCQASLGGIVQI